MTREPLTPEQQATLREELLNALVGQHKPAALAETRATAGPAIVRRRRAQTAGDAAPARAG